MEMETSLPEDVFLPVCKYSPGTFAVNVALSADDAQLHVAEIEYTGESMVMNLGGVQKQSLLELMDSNH